MRITSKGQVTIPQGIRRADRVASQHRGRVPRGCGRRSNREGDGPTATLARGFGCATPPSTRVHDLDVHRRDHGAHARGRMTPVLVDSNVLLERRDERPDLGSRPSRMLEDAADHAVLVINPLVYARSRSGSRRIEDVESALPADLYRREALPWEAGTSRASVSSTTVVRAAPSARLCRTSTSVPMPRSRAIAS